MSPPTPSKKAAPSPNGHAVRPVISTKRRNDIWNHFYRAGMETPTCKDWCTRDELVKISLAKPGLESLTTQELTEVLRGKKHKVSLGVESKKIEGGNILWRIIEPGTKVRASAAKKSPATPSKKPPATTSKKATATASKKATTTASKKATATPSKKTTATPSTKGTAAPSTKATAASATTSAKKATPSSKRATSIPSKAKAKGKASATPSGEPKPNVDPPSSPKPRTKPIRPKLKSPRATPKSTAAARAPTTPAPAPAPVRPSRKRSATSDSDEMATPLRPAITKKARVSSERGSRSVSFKVKPGQADSDANPGEMAAAAATPAPPTMASEGDGSEGGSWCTIS